MKYVDCCYNCGSADVVIEQDIHVKCRNRKSKHFNKAVVPDKVCEVYDNSI